jgi:hypothetical protein
MATSEPTRNLLPSTLAGEGRGSTRGVRGFDPAARPVLNGALRCNGGCPIARC